MVVTVDEDYINMIQDCKDNLDNMSTRIGDILKDLKSDGANADGLKGKFEEWKLRNNISDDVGDEVLRIFIELMTD